LSAAWITYCVFASVLQQPELGSDHFKRSKYVSLYDTFEWTKHEGDNRLIPLKINSLIGSLEPESAFDMLQRTIWSDLMKFAEWTYASQMIKEERDLQAILDQAEYQENWYHSDDGHHFLFVNGMHIRGAKSLASKAFYDTDGYKDSIVITIDPDGKFHAFQGYNRVHLGKLCKKLAETQGWSGGGHLQAAGGTFFYSSAVDDFAAARDEMKDLIETWDMHQSWDDIVEY